MFAFVYDGSPLDWILMLVVTFGFVVGTGATADSYHKVTRTAPGDARLPEWSSVRRRSGRSNGLIFRMVTAGLSAHPDTALRAAFARPDVPVAS